jgi:hypothetical protein
MRTGTAAAILTLLLLSTGCASARSAPRRTLDPDSAAALRRALPDVQPAFDTQEDALRSGIYDQAAPPPAEPRLLGEPVARTPAAAPAPPAPAPAAPPAPARTQPPAPAPTSLSGEEDHRYVIQIAAFRDSGSAGALAAVAARDFPNLPTVVDYRDGWFSVSLAGWPTAEDAAAALESVRSRHRSAWVRERDAP